ncbi:indole-3-glycerol phosphate synthase [Panacagrimonas perspica]|uniref:Indole-3-glycerol phosphate synthase n=1 Tax=Panacagrimonas perspica TaxID=381431 RepID=A0A4S3K9P6_9GAMM|nr:indole-3-glycerol phosphate synthase TrpC [Panacagrimonas perspica]TDU28692.1 indole-3-glycerol phosphate synthase [Panacagrimonas perspica]THD05017.1 indole-3-glycerol phosphate synthase [Panacagrimonas perspica]
MNDILERILTRKREEVALLRKQHTAASLMQLAQAQSAPRGFCAGLRAMADAGKPAVIAEIKRASPSKGLIRPDFDPAWIAGEYERGGAACLSILTDEDYFQGSADDFKAARNATALPAIRKDFIIDELQVIESRAIGADCILLIAAALPPARLSVLHRTARELGMDVLIEVHDRSELNAVLGAKLGPGLLIGINNRNLRSFETRLETTLDLLPWLPPGHEVVTESGIGTPADVQRMLAAGVQRFLVGESLMRQPNPGVALKRLVATS